MIISISDVIVGKPSKALEVAFIIFGYVLASYVMSPGEPVLEQFPVMIIAGAIFSSFLYYVKPVDNIIIISLFLIRKPEIARAFGSPLLVEERAKINGAVLFSLSLLLASRLLSLINLNIPFEILLFLSALIMVAAILETLQVVTGKIPIINKYLKWSFSGIITKEFKEAVEGKKWRLAGRLADKIEPIIPKELIQDAEELSVKITAPYKEGGFCPECGLITNRDQAHYCSNCGKILRTYCPNCKKKYGIFRYVITEKTDEIPKYCDFCGKAFFKEDKKFCSQCSSIIVTKEGLNYCSECGSKVISLPIQCNFCKTEVITENTDKIPKYCDFCGKSLADLWEKEPSGNV